MKLFTIIHEKLGKVGEEVVHGCHSVEDYVSRKYGSMKPEDHGYKVEMKDLEAPAAPVTPTPAPVTTATAPTAPATTAEAPATPAATDPAPAAK